MVLIGLGAIYGGTNYHIGSLSHMGPGFFPAALGGLLALTGVLIAMSARSGESTPPAPGDGHAHGLPDVRGSVCIILGILAFLLLGEYGGLLPATFAVVFISALGDRKNTIKQAILLAIAMSAIAVVVFWWALQLQMPLFRWG
ncbi:MULTISPECIES: tripartite tricarboxylate transporter TctB family protein [Achromobacter]|uniref:Tripartite tricarboxylate transporter TctB family protein n=1 Tax=Achromobacter spanius TaxID=217203 RepID=A0ABY8H229_9BURK|nr:MULTISPECIES: tripartite tricarboxylate transporter TctB family protein [Achromobacter]WAI86245.1 tripartite tricarboxylate transporter TctB family protein [Achromobacter spanius]WEX97498.1 tripartite tricarboxylate transporter TctB family protein [Achromobacter sp. SS2-2022]WFP11200.1 tripartite tricarboxylate transporter TctB family protein [Achromobacter spanius]